jgi:hypothetical protein
LVKFANQFGTSQLRVTGSRLRPDCEAGACICLGVSFRTRQKGKPLIEKHGDRERGERERDRLGSQMTLLQWMTRRGALVINVTLLHDEKPQGLLLAPVMKQKIGKEILIFGSSGVQNTTASGGHTHASTFLYLQQWSRLGTSCTFRSHKSLGQPQDERHRPRGGTEMVRYRDYVPVGWRPPYSLVRGDHLSLPFVLYPEDGGSELI